MYWEPDIQNLENLRPEPERSNLRRRDQKLNADSEATSPRVSRSMKDASSSTCTDHVEMFSIKVNLKVFCPVCLCIILCDSSKASENLTLISKEIVILSSICVIVCCVNAKKTKETVEQIALGLFKTCKVPEEVSVNFDPEIVLNDDAVGRSR